MRNTSINIIALTTWTLAILALFTWQPAHGQSIADYDRTSIVNLIATPDRFHMRKIAVAGWVTLKFEDMSLCLAERVPSAKECLWLSIETNSEKQKVLLSSWERYNGRRVVVNGIFDKDELGHLGGWSGGLTDIVRIAPLD